MSNLTQTHLTTYLEENICFNDCNVVHNDTPDEFLFL